MRRASALLPLVALLAGTVASAADLTITRDGRPAAVLVVGTRSDSARQAAGELLGFIERISGTKLEITDAPGDRPFLWLGLLRDCPEEAQRVPLKPETLCIFTTPRGLYLTGADDAALAHAIYAFLEKLGCRWYMPGPVGENIPHSPTLAVQPMTEMQTPDFVHRSVWWAYGGRPAWMREQYAEWCRRNRMGGVAASMGHNLMRIVPPAKFGETHPEYFPLRGGIRRVPGPKDADNWQPCTTNPDVVRLAIEAARDYFDKNPAAWSFSLSPNDGYGWCECEACRALDPPEWREADGRGKAGRMLAFANQVAEGLAKTHPAKFVAWYAYAGTVEPPAGPKVHPNCIVSLAHYGWCGCNVHPMQDLACPQNAKFIPIVEGWSKLAHTLFAREYFALIAGPADGLARVAAGYSLARDIPFYRAHGFAGINSESVADYGIAALNFWLAARLMWNASANVEALLEDYYGGMYRAAAKPMRAYFEACRDVARSHAHHGRLFAEEDMARLQRLLDEAERACRTDRERQRVGVARDYFAFVAKVRAFSLSPTPEARRELSDLLAALEAQRSLAVDFVAYRHSLLAERKPPTLSAAGLLATPLQPLLAAPLPEGATKARATFRGLHTWLVLLRKGEELQGSIATRRLGRYFDETLYGLFGPDGTRLAEGRAPVAGEPAAFRVAAAADGLHALVVDSGQNACRVAVSSGHCVHEGRSIAFLGATERLYFATKPGAREVTVGLETPWSGETAVLILYDPEGREVFRGDTTERGSIAARAPVGGEGIQVWSFQLQKAPKGVCEDAQVTLGDGTQPYLATHPARLLVARGR